MQSMNICDLIYHSYEVREVIEAKMASGMTMDEAIDSLTDEVMEQTKREGEQGICHGTIHDIPSDILKREIT